MPAKYAAARIELHNTQERWRARQQPNWARDASVATLLPNLVWIYLSWRHQLGIPTIYVWPWVLLTTLLYARRADKFGLNARLHGIIEYDLLTTRVVALPFPAAITLPLLNFVFNPRAPGNSVVIVLLVVTRFVRSAVESASEPKSVGSMIHTKLRALANPTSTDTFRVTTGCA